MNVADQFQNLTPAEIKQHCQKNSIDAAVAISHVWGDYNLSTLVRNCNFFGLRETFYFGGKKQWDRRGSVGTHHYTDITFLKTEEEFVEKMQKDGRFIVAVENNVPQFAHKTYDAMNRNSFPHRAQRPVFVFGEEGKGLSDYVLDKSDRIITIEAYGSVRSLNVGTTSGIILAFYRSYYGN